MEFGTYHMATSEGLDMTSIRLATIIFETFIFLIIHTVPTSDDKHSSNQIKSYLC